MEYDDVRFKIPRESRTYQEDSNFVVEAIESILQDAIDCGLNKIILNTNLKLGLPMENINKIAGPIIEAWAFEIFSDIKDDLNNAYHLVNVESRPRCERYNKVIQLRP